jgi:hypothetical protein
MKALVNVIKNHSGEALTETDLASIETRTETNFEINRSLDVAGFHINESISRSRPLLAQKHLTPAVSISTPIKRPLPNAIKQHFENMCGGDIAQLQRSLFFITVNFNLRKSSSVRPNRTQLSEFSELYFCMSKSIFGNNLGRKRRQQPLCYAFTDFEGSRNGRSEAAHSTFPHIHALMCVRPGHLEEFKPVISEPGLRSFSTSIKDIQVQNYSSEKSPLETLISYCMKGVNQTPKSAANREDLWAVFPA